MLARAAQPDPTGPKSRRAPATGQKTRMAVSAGAASRRPISSSRRTRVNEAPARSSVEYLFEDPFLAGARGGGVVSAGGRRGE
ncbi:MAG: hypothetical protein QOH97_1048 [Actinoplanes sp.]|nr:hypothetical protein [Actinoplanes sp.]